MVENQSYSKHSDMCCSPKMSKYTALAYTVVNKVITNNYCSLLDAVNKLINVSG